MTPKPSTDGAPTRAPLKLPDLSAILSAANSTEAAQRMLPANSSALYRAMLPPTANAMHLAALRSMSPLLAALLARGGGNG